MFSDRSINSMLAASVGSSSISKARIVQLRAIGARIE
jgi:hypothetical protein